VDIDQPGADRIQGAVDASQAGDTINVAGGTYYENVQIDKSLSIKGIGSGDRPTTGTTVEGQHLGSVFVIGMNDPEIEVAISGLTMQGGSGTMIELSPPYSYLTGGGIVNYGNLTLNDCSISGNAADIGGGISNWGKLDIENSSVEYNSAQWGGGIKNYGTVNLNSGSIGHNSAFDGGGIDNSGLINLNGGSVHDNTANAGGGILNAGASLCTLNLYGGSIEDNTANYGGGIYNGFYGIVILDGSSIERNTAAYGGGGIYNFGIVDLFNGSIAYNLAISTPYYTGGGIDNKATVIGNWSLVHDNIPPP
jgi:hypothetical protein